MMQVLANQQATMSSLEIAELTGKEHRNVVADIKNILDQAGIEGAKFSAPYKMPSGQNTNVYNLPRRECDLVISGYSVKYRLAIIDRWQELEQLQQAGIPRQLSRMEILTIAIEAEKENQALKEEVAEIKPKAEALDRISTSDGSMCITNAAKDLQMRPKDLFISLSEQKWIYRRAGGTGWVAYQDKLQTGYLEHKVTVVTRTDGTEKTTEQVRVTPKGLAKLAEKFSQRKAVH